MDGAEMAIYIGDFNMSRRRWQRERQKSNRFNRQHNNSARASPFFNLYISLPSLHNYDVKWPKFELTWERDRQGDKFIHLSLNLDAVPSLQFLPNFPTFK